MNRDIEIVPALKRLQLKHIGCWDELCIEFLPGLNIITGAGGSGKSTILRSIMQSVHPSAQMQYSVTPTHGYPAGEILVELMTANVILHIPEPSVIQLTPPNIEPMGTCLLKLLQLNINTASPGLALLVEGDLTGKLDARQFTEAAQLMNESNSQVICIIRQQHRIHPDLFGQARVYACFWDQAAERAGIRLQQSDGMGR